MSHQIGEFFQSLNSAIITHIFLLWLSGISLKNWFVPFYQNFVNVIESAVLTRVIWGIKINYICGNFTSKFISIFSKNLYSFKTLGINRPKNKFLRSNRSFDLRLKMTECICYSVNTIY